MMTNWLIDLNNINKMTWLSSRQLLLFFIFYITFEDKEFNMMAYPTTDKIHITINSYVGTERKSRIISDLLLFIYFKVKI